MELTKKPASAFGKKKKNVLPKPITGDNGMCGKILKFDTLLVEPITSHWTRR